MRQALPLAKQIEQGAPADLFLSADLDWMDYLATKKPHQGRHPREPSGQPDRSDRAQSLQGYGRTQGGVDLAQALAAALSMANVDRRARGKYARRRWKSSAPGTALKDRLAQAENVRAAL